MTQSATQLVDADVAADVGHDVIFDPTLDPTRSTLILTRPGQRPGPGQALPGQRSRTRPGQARPGQARPGQRSTTRPGQQNPPAVARAATRCHTRRTFWWRVRARVMVFLGKLDIYRFVSKFSTMWYIDLVSLKLFQI